MCLLRLGPKIMNADRYDGPDTNVCSKYFEKYLMASG